MSRAYLLLSVDQLQDEKKNMMLMNPTQVASKDVLVLETSLAEKWNLNEDVTDALALGSKDRNALGTLM